jgi:hypothetical protein
MIEMIVASKQPNTHTHHHHHNLLTKNKVDIVTEQGERRVFPRLTSLGIMRHGPSTTTLIPQLQHGNHRKDLPLGTQRHGIPLCLRHQIRRGMGSTRQGLCPGEYKVRLDNVSYECEHGNASMFDFRLTKPADGGFVALAPKVLCGEVEWVVVFDDGVGFSGEEFEISLAFGNAGDTTRSGWGGSKGCRGGEDGC